MTTAAVQLRPRREDAVQPDLTLTTDRIEDISTVRHTLADALQSRSFTESLVDTAVLLATELLSNALKHARAGGSPVAVRLDAHWNGPRVVLVVTDPDPRLPVARASGADAEAGRGLALVEALAARWGTRRVRTGKIVWCLII